MRSFGLLLKSDVCSTLLCLRYVDLTPSPVSVPFQHIDGTSSEKFSSPLFMGTCQSAMSTISALIYLFIRRKSGQTIPQLLGLEHLASLASNGSTHNNSEKPKANGSSTSNGSAHTNGHAHTKSSTRYSPKSLLLRYFQCAVFITSAAPFGFAALNYITYPAMVLGKSCKLVPVMLMNVLLYRRKFAAHKYLVVAMVTVGITMFMGFGKEKPGKSGKSSGDLSMSTQMIVLPNALHNYIFLLVWCIMSHTMTHRGFNR